MMLLSTTTAGSLAREIKTKIVIRKETVHKHMATEVGGITVAITAISTETTTLKKLNRIKEYHGKLRKVCHLLTISKSQAF